MVEANSSSKFAFSLESTGPILQTLRSRGWSLGETDEVKALIVLQTALSDAGDALSVADSVESDLLNTDLRSIGSDSLPDPASLLNRKTSYLHGPKVLQICSVRDVSVSREEEFTGSGNRRLLRFVLTDGKRDIVAIEYSPVPSIPSDVVPGTKVRVENKAPIHGGILCLNTKVITLLGGIVQSLHEEWQMNRKYSGLLRSSLRQSQEIESGGPPPFEKLHTPSSHWPSQQRRSSDLQEKNTFTVYPGSTSKSSGATLAHAAGSVENRQIGTAKIKDSGKAASFRDEGSMTSIGDEGKAASIEASAEKKLIETRPREVAEAVPIQNQEAAQKLLQKRSQTTYSGQHSRNRKHKGKEEQEQEVFTLDEWEKRNAGEKPRIVIELPESSQDEDLARQLQNQLDMEDYHVRGRANTVADDIRLSMFKFGRDADNDQGMEHGGRGGGRGKGRGRGRGRGRGKWRGRGRFD